MEEKIMTVSELREKERFERIVNNATNACSHQKVSDFVHGLVIGTGAFVASKIVETAAVVVV